MGWFSKDQDGQASSDQPPEADQALYLGEMALGKGHYPSALELGRTAMGSSTPEVRGAAALLIVTANYLGGNYLESRQGAGQALAGRLDPEPRLRMLLVLGKSCSVLGLPEEARRAFSEGRHGAESSKPCIPAIPNDIHWSQRLLVEHTRGLAESWAGQGHYQLASEWLAEADRLAAVADEPAEQAINDLVRAEAFREAGEYTGAILFAERADERLVAIQGESEALAFDRVAGFLIAAQSSAAAGRVEEARGFMVDVADHAERFDLPLPLTRRVRWCGLDVATAALDFASAEPLDAWMLSNLETVPGPEAAQIRWSCARYRVAAGLPDAQPLLASALAFYESIHHQPFTTRLRAEIATL